MKRVLAVCLLLGIVCVTAGCNPFRRSSAAALCKGPETYAAAETAPSLKIPAGLEAPDTRNALRIPDLNTPEPPRRTTAQGCLDEPPPYVVPKAQEPEA